MKNIERDSYYIENNEGFMIFLLSRLYNDLQIDTALVNSIKDDSDISDGAKIYLFKILISHLKEGLKILGKMKRSPKYNSTLISWSDNNPIIAEILKEISDELENPTYHKDTVNNRYLNIRNEVFHYCTDDPKDFEFYKEVQENMIKQNLTKVYLKFDEKGKYKYELGIDVPIIGEKFNNSSLTEVNALKEKVLILVKEILTDYNKKFN
jgi:hypothetical protein